MSKHFLSFDVELGHMTDFGQWNITKHDKNENLSLKKLLSPFGLNLALRWSFMGKGDFLSLRSFSLSPSANTYMAGLHKPMH